MYKSKINIIYIFKKIIFRFNTFKEHPLVKYPSYGIIKYLYINFILRYIVKQKTVKWVNGLKYYLSLGDSSMIGIYYFTFPDYPEFIFLLSYLNKKDVFIDIGSNQGLYTLFVSGIIGSKTISIEPVQNTYKRLLLNLKLNNLKNVEPLNIGLSNQIGIINMSNNKGELNKILINDDDNSEMVTVSTLDKITQNKKNISLLKIDVEGYEKFILEGGINTLKNINLKVILIELNGSNEYYNYSEKDIINFLNNFHFKPYKYDPYNNKLISLNNKKNSGTYNTIFIKDFDSVNEKINDKYISIKYNTISVSHI